MLPSCKPLRRCRNNGSCNGLRSGSVNDSCHGKGGNRPEFVVTCVERDMVPNVDKAVIKDLSPIE